MSRLDELIAELCPDGVEYIPMGNLMTRVRERGKDSPEVKQVYAVSNTLGMVNAEEYRDNTIHSEDTSNYTVVRQGMVAYNPSRLNIGSIAMLKSSNPGLVSPMYVVFSIDENRVCRGYFDYLMHSSYIASKIDSYKEEGARFRFDYSRWDWIMVQIPPLPVQQEIVRILDSFTSLTAELTAELTARQKQYEYYRNKLIEEAQGKKGKLIDLLVQPITDGPHTTPKLVSEGIPFISATAVYDGRVHLESAQGFITEDFDRECAKKYKPRKYDVYMVKSGSTTGKVAIVDTDDNFNIWSPLAAMRTESETTARYLYHLLQTSSVQNQVLTRMSHGSQPNLSMRALEQFDVKVPTLPEQSRIVNILDKMDAISINIFNGLPAEIAARQKQYEYYRDKLLTFKPKEEVSA